jgi:hypothetical protein
MAGIEREFEMEKTRLSIHEVVKTAIHAEDVELIDVPVEGEAVTLLRNKTMPEYAFVMWVSQETGTSTQMSFNLPNDEKSDYYPVVCACCRSEVFGVKGGPQILTNSKEERDARDAWEEPKRVAFKAAIESTCQANGISTLFMRKAHQWEKRYGCIDGVQCAEAGRFMDDMTLLYGRQIIRQGLRFFDHRNF